MSCRWHFFTSFFLSHSSNMSKRDISNFIAKDVEKFFGWWERFKDVICACPHHGFDSWMLVSHFYEGMLPQMNQRFMSKSPDEAIQFVKYVADVSKGCEDLVPKVFRIGLCGRMLNTIKVWPALTKH